MMIAIHAVKAFFHKWLPYSYFQEYAKTHLIAFMNSTILD